MSLLCLYSVRYYDLSFLKEGFAMKENISKIFNKFAGREVQVAEYAVRTKNGCRMQYSFANNDPVIEEIRQEASAHGYVLRPQLPGTTIAKNIMHNRLNIYAEKSTDGKWRVSNKFVIG